jgi:TonB family protein
VGGAGGSFSLSGRSLGKGGLPNPVYNVQDEGKVMVNITVNPAGQVVSASLNLKGTTTSNAALRKAAIDAAKKARFNEVEGTTNQTGTITYIFNLN